MSLPWINDSDLLWDTLILGGEVWPGLPTVEATKPPTRAVDAQKRKGDDGATLADQGYEPAKLKITLRIWLREQWVELQRLLPSIHPRRPGGLREPVEIIHPAAQLVGVRSVYFLTPGMPTAKDGLLTLVMEAIEWFPAPKAQGGKLRKAKAQGGLSDDGGEIPDGPPPNRDGSAVANF